MTNGNGIPNPDDVENQLRSLGALGGSSFGEAQVSVALPSSPLPHSDRELMLKLIRRIEEKQHYIEAQQAELNKLIDGLKQLASLPPAE